MNLIQTHDVRRELIAQEISNLLQSRILQSERAIDPGKPVGALGLGLDSLALLQFITAIENQYEIEFSDTLLSEQGSITINRLAELVHAQNTHGAQASTPQSVSGDPVVETRSIRRILREDGIQRGFLPTIRLLPVRLWKRIYYSDLFYIIMFDLAVQPIPEYQTALPLEFRAATPNDVDRVDSIWRSHERQMKRRLFTERLANGMQGYLALLDGRPVGIDWLTTAGDVEENMGLKTTLGPAVCQGLDLDEHPDYKGKGVGMALLVHVLRAAREQGMKRQYAIVHCENEKMLAGAIHLLGFTKIGEIMTRTLFRSPRSQWTANSERRSGRLLELR